MGPFGWLISFWTIPLFYDTIVFLLTAWKAYGYWKKEVDTPLFDIMWRDGLLYFFTIFSMNLTNVVIFLTVPPALRAVNLTPTLILEVILSCRLLLNLRSAGQTWASKLTPPIIPSFNNSKTFSIGSQVHSTELPSTPGREEMNLAPVLRAGASPNKKSASSYKRQEANRQSTYNASRHGKRGLQLNSR
jgi:hypothetical protein